MYSQSVEETESEVVYATFYKRKGDFKIPKLKKGIYLTDPSLIGGSHEYRASSFTDYLHGKDLKKIFGKTTFFAETIENPYAKIILDYDGVFKEHFTGKKIYALPYKFMGTTNHFLEPSKRLKIYSGETRNSLKQNGINSLFVHLEDLYLTKPKELKKVYKFYKNKKRLAIFEQKFLEFAQTTEEVLSNTKASNSYVLLKRKDK